MRKDTAGFSVLELIVALAVIGVLGFFAIPAYFNYQHRISFSPVIQAAEPFKTAVSECYKKLKTLTGCNAGSNQIPAAMTTAKDAVAKLTVTNGVIAVTPVAREGVLTTDTYVLTPAIQKGEIAWKLSGGSVANGYVN